MNTKLIRAVPFALLGLAGLAGAETAAEHHVLTGAAAIKWGPPPAVFPAGAKFAVVDGDPAAKGLATVRFMMPAGYLIAPHWHPQRENVTVLSGTFKVGMGDRFDESTMASFPAGSFAYLDPDMHHYAMTAGEVVVQVHGTAPLQFNYVNPSDDPSRNK